MQISLQGARNARDLGGMVTPLGTIQSKRLIRSGHLGKITQQDAKILLKEYNLVRVVDLRTIAEQANTPDVQLEGVEYLTNPIISATTFGITYEQSTGEEICKMLQAGIKRMIDRGENPNCHLEILYRKFVNDPLSRKGYGSFLKLLANNPVDGATLWHCSAGKDRVGTCTALLLHCLGASRKQILADYLLTNTASKGFVDMVMGKISNTLDEYQISLIMGMLGVKDSYLEAFWTEINTHYGNVDNFIAECGVTQEDIANLRKNYLE